MTHAENTNRYYRDKLTAPRLLCLLFFSVSLSLSPTAPGKLIWVAGCSG